MFDILTRNDSDYPNPGNLVLLALCGYVIIWYLQLGFRIPALGKIRFELYYAASLSVLAIASAFKHKVDLDCPAVKWAILFLLAIFIQVALSQNFELSWTIFIDRVVKFSFMAFFIISFVRSPKHLIFFLAAFLLACMKMGQEGIVGQLTGNLVWQNQGVMRLHGSTPLYEHPNSFAGMALGSIPFIVYLFPIVPKYIKVVFVVQLIFAFNIVLHTGSRTGYVGFLFMLLFLIYKSKNKKKAILLATTILIFYLPFIGDQYVARFESIYTGQEIEGRSIDARKIILEDAAEVFFEYPFGVGVGLFPTVRFQMFGRSQDTHNLYLEVATNLGIQGLTAFVFLVAIMMSSLLKGIHSVMEQKKNIQELLDGANMQREDLRFANNHKIGLDLIEATSKAVILFLVLRLVLGMFGMDLYEIYWWFSLGIVVSLHNMINYSKVKTMKLLSIVQK